MDVRGNIKGVARGYNYIIIDGPVRVCSRLECSAEG